MTMMITMTFTIILIKPLLFNKLSMAKVNGLFIEVPPRPRRKLQQPTRMDEFTGAQRNEEDSRDIDNYFIAFQFTTQH